MMDRWRRLFQLEACQATLDWELFFWSHRAQGRQLQIFWTKFNARILPVGTNLKRRLHSDSESCPCCGELEDHDHLLCCPHPTMALFYQECLSSVEVFVQQHMDPYLAQDILYLLQIFRNNDDGGFQPTTMATQQIELGSRSFLGALASTVAWSAREVFAALSVITKSHGLGNKIG